MTNKTHLSQIDEKSVLFADGSALLAASSSLVGDVVHVSGFTHLTGYIYSDVDSAAGGVIIEQGIDIDDFPSGTPATSLVTNSAFACTGGDIVSNAFSVQIVAPYVRVIYINGASNQGAFRAIFEARILRGL